MPPLKGPASFHEQRRNLERARTEDYLKRKIRCRPERSELVRMHILEETSAEPSLQAKQLKLKRARLADDLNEKISQRPGPMELVVKNILPVETSIKEAVIDVNYSKVADTSSFDEDSSDALSPEQPSSQDSQGSVPSPNDSRESEAASLFSHTQSMTYFQLCPEPTEKPQTSELPQNTQLNICSGLSVQANRSVLGLIKSQSKPCSEKSHRNKKGKEPKPKVKKLKYHQYIPPDQKQKGTPAMDSSYAKILQQQQLFLQLQILNQQQHQHYNYQTILPAPPKSLPEKQQTAAISSTSAVLALPAVSTTKHAAPSVTRQNSSMAAVATKPSRLPHNLDDMKVAELKQELKQRGLHVSGTKVDLIERLKATQDHLIMTPAPVKSTSTQQATPYEPVSIFLNATSTEPAKLGNTSSTPPCSPSPSEISITSVEEAATSGELFAEAVSCPATPLIILSSPTPSSEKSSDVKDKDIMLREKDRQIEELTRRLKQKQELVEKLRQQLAEEKRTQLHQNCDAEQTISAQGKQNSVTSHLEKHTEFSGTKIALKSEFKMHTTCQQEEHLFKDSVPKINEEKRDNSSATKLVLTVSNPLTLLSEENQHVVLQSPNPHVQLGTGAVISFSISPQTEPYMSINDAEKKPTDSGKENQLNFTQKQLDVPCTPPAQPEPEPPPQSLFLASSLPTLAKKISEKPDLLTQPKAEVARQTGLQVDYFFDVLMHNLDLDSESKEFPVPSLKQTSTTHTSTIEVTQNEMSSQPSTAPGQLEDFLGHSTGTQLLQGDQDGSASVPLIDDLHSHMLSSLAMLDHLTSPMDTSDLHFSPQGDSLGLDISEPPSDGMDWLELAGPPAMNLTPLSTTTPSVFCTDFLDSQDLQLHWDSCL
ncbi:myocardin-related transcription factor A isoform X2 [Hyperolius riggenbachi]|uniref:myocardin-related transcription factor A isoform X2 n=1 Tax=Hyperolius riggenbachi TaxID=752182 RepID=UPI0035A3787C